MIWNHVILIFSVFYIAVFMLYETVPISYAFLTNLLTIKLLNLLTIKLWLY